MAAAEPRENFPGPALPAADRFALWGGLAVITILSWLYLLRIPMPDGMDMPGMPGMKMALSQPHPWSLGDAVTAFVMWSVMMIAMMVPSASPMITMYARAVRPREAGASAKIAMFVAGYIAAWTFFSAVATLIQLALQRTTLISADLTVTPAIGAAILIAAGIYQVTPLKKVCLRHCRSPLAFFMSEWREGAIGAFTMGLKHGLFCVGCCWMLMALLFAAGVMNLLWVAAIALFVLLEKVMPWDRVIANTAALTLVAMGVWIAFAR
jgi:predicted metal-binding membrane protein